VTPGVIWAIGTQTLRQCLRRKVLLVLLLFFGVVLVGSRVMPSHDPLKHLEMLIRLCLWSISFFGIIVAIFLAATVLGDDRTDQTITTVLTKPVGRLNYVLGRIFGFAQTLGIILLVMGVVSWGFIRWAGAAAGAASGRDDLLVGKRGIDPNEAFLHGDDATPKDAGDARAGVLRGSTERILVFCFRKKLRRLPPGEQTLELTPYIATAQELPNTQAEVIVSNPVTGERKLCEDVVLDSERTVAVTFPGTLVHPTEGVNVSIRRLVRGTYVRFGQGALQLMIPPVPFEVSYLKALAMIFLGFMLLVVVSITASTFLSSWVAVLVAFSAYFFAAFQEVLLDFMQGLQGKAVGLLGSEAFKHVHHHGPVPEPTPDPLYVVLINRLVWGSMWVLTRIFPNFDRFKASEFLTSARDVPWTVVGTAAVVFLAYAICYLVLGHVIFWRRELVP